MHKLFLIFGLVLAVCEATLLESLSAPCDSSDKDCLRGKFNEILQYLIKNGAPECGIPNPVDPYDLEKDNYRVSVLGGVDINVYNGYLEGLKTCEFTYSAINFELGFGIVKVNCEKLNIQGDYHLTGLLQGEGQADLSVGDLEIDFLKRVKIIKDEDGEYYLNFKENFNFKIGDLKFHVSDIHAGPLNITDSANELIQKNWKLLLPLLGRNFVSEAVRIFQDKVNKIYACIPAKYFVQIDDLRYITDE